jgi:hypothetical protein
MAHPVEDDLGDRPSAGHRLEPGFIINGLGQAQQRPPVVEVAAGDLERPCRLHRSGAERKRGVDDLRFFAERAQF